VTEGGSRRDARSRADELETAGVGNRAGSSPLDLPPTRRKRSDGDLVN
jgi:hypothetical protein